MKDITFKTTSYRKNVDMITNNENIITEYDGNITKLRINERKLPKIIGEYQVSTWNIRLAKLLNYNVINLLKLEFGNDIYDELLELVNYNNFDIYQYNKIVFIHSLVIAKEYRGRGISEEFTEFIYRDFYNGDNVLIISLVKPLQYNKYNYEHYFNDYYVIVKEKYSDTTSLNVLASEYYDLKPFTLKNDVELNQYKLFSAAKRCKFDRISDKFNLFKLNIDEFENHLKSKYM